jgi:hypothetical protein
LLLKGLGQLKNPIISLGIEPAAFRLRNSVCTEQIDYVMMTHEDIGMGFGFWFSPGIYL